MAVNFNGAVYVTKFALPHLLKQKESRIGVTSSISGLVLPAAPPFSNFAGLLGTPRRTFYSASKHAVNGYYKLQSLHVDTVGFFDSLRLEVESRGCAVRSPSRLSQH